MYVGPFVHSCFRAESTPDGGSHVTSWQAPKRGGGRRGRCVCVCVGGIATPDSMPGHERERAFSLCAVRSDDDRCESATKKKLYRNHQLDQTRTSVVAGLPNPGTGPDRYTKRPQPWGKKDPQISPPDPGPHFALLLCIQMELTVDSHDVTRGLPQVGVFPFSPPRLVRGLSAAVAQRAGSTTWCRSLDATSERTRCGAEVRT